MVHVEGDVQEPALTLDTGAGNNFATVDVGNYTMMV